MAAPQKEPAKQPANKGKKVSFAAVPVAVVVALAAVLGINSSEHEGRRYQPYLDSAGIPTVCAGITGPAVRMGKTYTSGECDKLEQDYIALMFKRMACVRGEFELYEAKAWGHFAYNVGNTAFCNSTAAKRLNAGERKPVCDEMWKWRFVTINGAKRDCADPKWSSKCGGIVKRRQWEMATCRGEST